MKQNLNIYSAYKWEINVKNQTYYFFHDMINIKNFDPSLIKIDKKSYKNIGIYHIGYITMKDTDRVKINSVNPLYFIIVEVGGYIEENNGNKYLTFGSIDKNKKLLQKYTKLCDKIKYRIQTINTGKFGEYEEDYMRIKFNLPLNKMLKLHNLTVIVRLVFEKDGEYYPQDF